ncbi:hypothetical protein [Vibrio furnissii]|uniref:hypothetical protein n=1 Tax=Vibrio furnissii TaxID=29494 RepID=UPI0030D545F9
MKLRSKMFISYVVVAACFTAVSCVALGWLVYQDASKALAKAARDKLVISRNETASQIQRYFDTVDAQAQNMSHDLSVRDAVVGFTQAFMDYPLSTTSSDALKGYYRNEFAARYQEINTVDRINADGLFGQISERAKTLQNQYIALNPNPLGSKDKLTTGEQGANMMPCIKPIILSSPTSLKTLVFTMCFWSMPTPVSWCTARTKSSTLPPRSNLALIKTAAWLMRIAARCSSPPAASSPTSDLTRLPTKRRQHLSARPFVRTDKPSAC